MSESHAHDLAPDGVARLGRPALGARGAVAAVLGVGAARVVHIRSGHARRRQGAGNYEHGRKS